jgi:hypothetical protein
LPRVVAGERMRSAVLFAEDRARMKLMRLIAVATIGFPILAVAVLAVLYAN